MFYCSDYKLFWAYIKLPRDTLLGNVSQPQTQNHVQLFERKTVGIYIGPFFFVPGHDWHRVCYAFP